MALANPMMWVLFPLLGAVSGLLAGMFGIGGGLVIVPVLNLIFADPALDIPTATRMHFAIGSSLAVIVFTAISSLRAHHKRGAVLWPAVWRLVPGIVIGGLLGAVLADAMSNRLLQSTFGGFVVAIAAYMAIGHRPRAALPLPSWPGFAAAGTLIGAVSALAGIGGGVLTVPFLVWRTVALHTAVGTAAACTMPVALAGATGFVLTGIRAGSDVGLATGYVYWPAVLGISLASVLTAPLGARLAHSLPVEKLRRAFAVLLVIVGGRMLFG
ncbi:MAG: sulfite exporter TauE/SafE family protein [Gammaproteobacteria bacterium]